MSTVVLFDASPLGLLSFPRGSPIARQCDQWLQSLLLNGAFVIIPEIADYEVRRELLRINKWTGIGRLDHLKSMLRYEPLTTETMLLAARYWADARRQGKPTADDTALDGDMILAAQATLLRDRADDVIIATTNVRHLSLFADARDWTTIEAR